MRAREERLRWRCASPSPTKLHPNCMLQMQCNANAAGTHVRTYSSSPPTRESCMLCSKTEHGLRGKRPQLLARSRSTATTCYMHAQLRPVVSGWPIKQKKNCKRLQVAGRACTVLPLKICSRRNLCLCVPIHSCLLARRRPIRPSVSERESSHGRARGPTRT